MDVVYDLRDDKQRVRHMQEATRSRPDAGLAPVPALIGSWRWWRAIKTGKLETVAVEGTITKAMWTGMGDYPEFSMVDANGETTNWTREGDYTRYVEGLAVRVEYVVQFFKDTIPAVAQGHLGPTTNQVIRISIEHSSARSSSQAPGPFGHQETESGD